MKTKTTKTFNQTQKTTMLFKSSHQAKVSIKTEPCSVEPNFVSYLNRIYTPNFVQA